MRLWTLHPKYLDPQGLVALWREGLLAQKVLQGKTKGYKNHPQLIRFKESTDPIQSISTYLHKVHLEARRRGYNFDGSKIISGHSKRKISETDGQLEYELRHLKRKTAPEKSILLPSDFAVVKRDKTSTSSPVSNLKGQYQGLGGDQRLISKDFIQKSAFKNMFLNRFILLFFSLGLVVYLIMSFSSQKELTLVGGPVASSKLKTEMPQTFLKGFPGSTLQKPPASSGVTSLSDSSQLDTQNWTSRQKYEFAIKNPTEGIGLFAEEYAYTDISADKYAYMFLAYVVVPHLDKIPQKYKEDEDSNFSNLMQLSVLTTFKGSDCKHTSIVFEHKDFIGAWSMWCDCGQHKVTQYCSGDGAIEKMVETK